MNKLILSLICLMATSTCLEAVDACVTYNPATNTYTVDPSGSISKEKTKKKHTFQKKSKKGKK